jgi:hypothetical protein
MSDEDLREWEQRLAAGRFLPGVAAAAPGPTEDFTLRRPAKPAPTPVLAAAAAAPAPEDSDGPHVFEDGEDSEVFSDLEF